ncbi:MULTISPECIES: cytidine deaminase [Gulosibacter]|jgi:cytidine deaminase|uniref:Cytidine deaminase n=1 Tax=Gulosibacter sediminis TaxID=1729695 RepID=A0ABY4N0D8_9MICO|nr:MULTISPECIES: cytidine deaminase [Gulosibacter]UQN16140.1 cytidine deaminase [Gulosibacter sediminis]
MRAVVDIDWETLRAAAREVQAHAYVPYSKFRVGAAALVDDGRIVTGCNVENASYGVGLCAECGLVSELARTGGGQLIAFTCCDGNGERLMPCGRCRQLLNEFAAPGCLFDTIAGITDIEGILPMAFGPRNLNDFDDRGEPA